MTHAGSPSGGKVVGGDAAVAPVWLGLRAQQAWPRRGPQCLLRPISRLALVEEALVGRGVVVPSQSLRLVSVEQVVGRRKLRELEIARAREPGDEVWKVSRLGEASKLGRRAQSCV